MASKKWPRDDSQGQRDEGARDRSSGLLGLAQGEGRQAAGRGQEERRAAEKTRTLAEVNAFLIRAYMRSISCVNRHVVIKMTTEGSCVTYDLILPNEIKFK